MNYLDAFRKQKKKQEEYIKPKRKMLSYKDYCIKHEDQIKLAGYSINKDGSVKKDRYADSYEPH